MSTRSTIRGAGNPEKLARLLGLIPDAAADPEYRTGTEKVQEKVICQEDMLPFFHGKRHVPHNFYLSR
jgi:hypothetical protein